MTLRDIGMKIVK